MNSKDLNRFLLAELALRLPTPELHENSVLTVKIVNGELKVIPLIVTAGQTVANIDGELKSVDYTSLDNGSVGESKDYLVDTSGIPHHLRSWSDSTLSSKLLITVSGDGDNSTVVGSYELSILALRSTNLVEYVRSSILGKYPNHELDIKFVDEVLALYLINLESFPLKVNVKVIA